MSSADFPTYGRGDDPAEPDGSDRYASPAPYGPGGYGQQPPAQPGQPAPGQGAPSLGDGQPPARGPQPPAHGQPSTYGQPPANGQPPAAYGQPPAYGPPPAYGQPSAYGQTSAYGTGQYGAPGHPQQAAFGEPAGPDVPRDPRAARVLLVAAIAAGVYGLLVLTIQRIALREIAQAPGSPLNHPMRTDVIDTIGQLVVVVVGGAAIALWVRDLLARRRAGRPPEPFELGGLALVAVSVVPLLVWLVMTFSTRMGAIDDALDRLPTAYGWGGTGLILLAAGFALGYRELKPEVSNPVVRPAPTRPPWE